MKETKKTVVVLFGGRSPEHDVSIITGLQTVSAIDATLYNVVPVYIAVNGDWYTGEALLDRDFYLPGPNDLAQLTPVTLDLMSHGQPRLLPLKKSFFNREKAIPFDVAVLAFHGAVGEDGKLQGLLDVAGVPYTGMRVLASAVLMDKIVTKKAFESADIPVLPYREIRRPARGLLIPPAELDALLGDFSYPLCVKPSHLGSSIGVARVNSVQELSDVLPGIFKYDDTAIVEPFVQNMIEYNVSVARMGGKIVTSAIERPKCTEELLDFKEKYGGGGKTGGKTGQKTGSKTSAPISEGMLSLTRELNPALPPEVEHNIRAWAERAFEAVNGTGAPRIDFICDGVKEEYYLNEVNPCPGSFGYFLWEAAGNPVLFSELMDTLIEEALAIRESDNLPDDPTPKDARLFPRKS